LKRIKDLEFYRFKRTKRRCTVADLKKDLFIFRMDLKLENLNGLNKDEVIHTLYKFKQVQLKKKKKKSKLHHIPTYIFLNFRPKKKRVQLNAIDNSKINNEASAELK
jgi:hypothetical protein